MVAEDTLCVRPELRVAGRSRPSGSHRRSVEVRLSLGKCRVRGRLHLDVLAVLHPLGGIVASGEVGGFLVVMFAGAKVCDGLCGGRLKVADGRGAHGRGGCRDLLLLLVHRVRGPWIREINVRRRLRELTLRLDEARLEVDDVVSQLVVFGLDGFVVFVQQVVVPHLLLELLDVSFFALAERTLSNDKVSTARSIVQAPVTS